MLKELLLTATLLALPLTASATHDGPLPPFSKYKKNGVMMYEMPERSVEILLQRAYKEGGSEALSRVVRVCTRGDGIMDLSNTVFKTVIACGPAQKVDNETSQ